MRRINGLQDPEICQPLWLTEFLVSAFPDLFLLYDDDEDDDFYSYIYPNRSDGVVNYFQDSQLREFFQLADYETIRLSTNFMTAVDYIQRQENLPVCHLENVRYLVSSCKSLRFLVLLPSFCVISEMRKFLTYFARF